MLRELEQIHQCRATKGRMIVRKAYRMLNRSGMRILCRSNFMPFVRDFGDIEALIAS